MDKAFIHNIFSSEKKHTSSLFSSSQYKFAMVWEDCIDKMSEVESLIANVLELYFDYAIKLGGIDESTDSIKIHKMRSELFDIRKELSDYNIFK